MFDEALGSGCTQMRISTCRVVARTHLCRKRRAPALVVQKSIGEPNFVNHRILCRILCSKNVGVGRPACPLYAIRGR